MRLRAGSERCCAPQRLLNVFGMHDANTLAAGCCECLGLTGVAAWSAHLRLADRHCLALTAAWPRCRLLSWMWAA